MKKIYNTPNINIYNVELSALMDASPNYLKNGEAQGGSSDNRVNFSRSGGSWDDED